MNFWKAITVSLLLVCSGCVVLKDALDPENSEQAKKARHEREQQQLRQEELARQKAEAQAEELEYRRERDAKLREWRSRDHWAIATGIGYVSGALVCPDYETFEFVYQGFLGALHDAMQDSVTNGQSRQLRRSRETPTPETYGCTLIPKGTRVLVKQGAYLPIVTATLRGRKVTGITNPGMIQYEEAPPRNY